MKNRDTKKVVILQYRLLHYRLSLFDKLHQTCEKKGIELCLVHGQPTAREEKKRDTGFLPWANAVVNRSMSIRGKDILWQPFPKVHKDADLVIFMQENRILSNYCWLFFRGLHKTKTGYWGHGRNFQSIKPTGFLEKWKKFLVGRVDWWFAYTELTKDILISDGYPGERISVLNNAIDNEVFIADLASITAAHIEKLQADLRLPDNASIGLFCGSLYSDKRLDYLVEAADKIKAELPEFHLIVIGDGPSAQEIESAALSRPWIHWVGVQKGVEKAAFFRLSHVILNPGSVGLHILDSFCSGLPMITTRDAMHGPEIAYLKNGENGVIVQGNASEYARIVVQLLKNSHQYTLIKSKVAASAQEYTLQNMVERFSDGIQRCLSSDFKS